MKKALVFCSIAVILLCPGISQGSDWVSTEVSFPDIVSGDIDVSVRGSTYGDGGRVGVSVSGKHFKINLGRGFKF